MKKHIGEVIPDLHIHGTPAPYPVLNERAIRATAGITFVLGFAVMMYTILTKDRSIMYYILPVFWFHFFLVTFLGPRYAPFSLLGSLLVRNQRPEYVGAIQKRFAWGMGLCMATIMAILVYVYDIRSGIPLMLCSICLLFMWLESAVGLCVGCKIYYRAIRKKLISEPDYRPACPGGVCEIPINRKLSQK